MYDKDLKRLVDLVHFVRHIQPDIDPVNLDIDQVVELIRLHDASYLETDDANEPRRFELMNLAFGEAYDAAMKEKKVRQTWVAPGKEVGGGIKVEEVDSRVVQKIYGSLVLYRWSNGSISIGTIAPPYGHDIEEGKVLVQWLEQAPMDEGLMDVSSLEALTTMPLKELLGAQSSEEKVKEILDKDYQELKDRYEEARKASTRAATEEAITAATKAVGESESSKDC